VEDTTVAGPDAPGRPRRLAWAELLERAWRLDALACPQRGGRMGLIAVILDPGVAEKILAHLRLASRAPPTRWVTPELEAADAPLVD
jgi:hypothetical protein